MSRELDEACALALGWEGVGIACMMGPYEDLYYKSHTNDGYDVVPEFSTDVSAACELEDEIERRGLWMEYTAALLPELNLNRTSIAGSALWAAIRATPEQRARAFLKAVK